MRLGSCSAEGWKIRYRPLNLGERSIRGVDISSQVFPDILRHFEKNFDDLRIELAP
jgi:hypothetical protein